MEAFTYKLCRIEFMYSPHLKLFLCKPFDCFMVLDKTLCFISLIALKKNCSQDTNSLVIFWSDEFVYYLLRDIAVVAMCLALG